MFYLTTFQEGRRTRALEQEVEWIDEEQVLGRRHLALATVQLMVALGAAWGLILGCI